MLWLIYKTHYSCQCGFHIPKEAQFLQARTTSFCYSVWNDAFTFLFNFFLIISSTTSGCPFKVLSQLETESKKNDKRTQRKFIISFKPRPHFPGVQCSWNLLHYVWSRESNTLIGPQNILESTNWLWSVSSDWEQCRNQLANLVSKGFRYYSGFLWCS